MSRKMRGNLWLGAAGGDEIENINRGHQFSYTSYKLFQKVTIIDKIKIDKLLNKSCNVESVQRFL